MKITDSAQLHQLFHRLRLEADMSAEGLAARLGVSPSTVWDRERGAARRMSVDALVKAADVFGIDVVLVRRDTGKPA
jgi:transcriptional regulator with XRE-family HTH domain